MESLLVGKQSRAYCPPIFRCFSILFLFSALRCAVVLPTATTVSGDMAGERTVTTKLVDLGRSDAPEPTMPGSVRVPEERLESARSSRLSPGTRSRIHSSSRTHGRPYRKPGMIAVALLGVILAVLYAKRPSPAAAEKVVQLTERWIEKPWRP
ncbi:hypothetical protein CSUI_011151 [Cystoisospora suis]|uniref:Transmembrane protein n=1 Tax=Cystoisospora suis TaxID=483139 RepID=A0A2C6KEG5_9APIC|nr:hypothetical protein CSUI_011151 [Cystoisospora suis]